MIDLFSRDHERVIEQRAAQYQDEIRAMVEFARRSIGQRHRRSLEKTLRAAPRRGGK